MIDFNFYKFANITTTKDRKEACAAYESDLKNKLEREKDDKFFIGAKLIDFYRSQTYSMAEDIVKLSHSDFKERFGFEKPLGAGNCWSGYFLAFCSDRFNLERSAVSRLMNVVDEFGDGFRNYAEEWKNFSYSQLVEMLPLLPFDRKPIQPDWSIKKIRDYKKSLKAKKITPEMPIAEEEDESKNKYVRFEKWTRPQLCDKIFELEEELANACEQIEEYKAKEKKAIEEQAAEVFSLPKIGKKLKAIV